MSQSLAAILNIDLGFRGTQDEEPPKEATALSAPGAMSPVVYVTVDTPNGPQHQCIDQGTLPGGP